MPSPSRSGEPVPLLVLSGPLWHRHAPWWTHLPKVATKVGRVPWKGCGRMICVAGSANLDLVVRVDHLPRPGETVLGAGLQRVCGGKGANQAVAAARLGAQLAFIGRVGDDGEGQMLRTALRDAEVDLTHLSTDTVHTGIAHIAVDPQGENLIVVSPGANARVDERDVHAARGVLAACAATMLQLEIPVAAVTRAARLAGGLIVLNPAPAQRLDPDLLALVDVLVPNRTELATLAGVAEPHTVDEVVVAARALHLERMVVTLGQDGVVVLDGGRVDHLPAYEVTAVDATAAGDAFCAGLTVRLVEGATLLEAARFANATAAITVTRRGAQPSLPTRVEVDALLA